MTDSQAFHAVVTGRVQGVAFRASTRDEATSLGVSGWVRNRSDGAVEVKAWGAPEALNALRDWLQHGPPMARVEAVRCEDAEPEAGKGFRIRY